MRTTWNQRTDGEWFAVPNRSLHRIRCCDCSLVHDFSFRIRKGKLQIRAVRNNRSTAASRATRTPPQEGR
jgi:hypothetical protein